MFIWLWVQVEIVGTRRQIAASESEWGGTGPGGSAGVAEFGAVFPEVAGFEDAEGGDDAGD